MESGAARGERRRARSPEVSSGSLLGPVCSSEQQLTALLAWQTSDSQDARKKRKRRVSRVSLEQPDTDTEAEPASGLLALGRAANRSACPPAPQGAEACISVRAGVACAYVLLWAQGSDEGREPATSRVGVLLVLRQDADARRLTYDLLLAGADQGDRGEGPPCQTRMTTRSLTQARRLTSLRRQSLSCLGAPAAPCGREQYLGVLAAVLCLPASHCAHVLSHCCVQDGGLGQSSPGGAARARRVSGGSHPAVAGGMVTCLHSCWAGQLPR